VQARGAWVSDVAGPGRDGRGCLASPASERTAVLAYASSERVRLARACRVSRKPVP